ncbi:pentatricopeptide repeat-containing protein At4g21300-like [Tasmannia lanceolata]|uniref:pentatricopeptide repeat-containing protein At4g21300-like n=1 Tax=Tasmannia lanceolata TaxID=3420 RepID=UPI0040632B4B
MRQFTTKYLFLETLLLFKKLLLSPSKPNRYTFPLLLKSCTGLVAPHMGLGLHGLTIKYGFQSSITVGFYEDALMAFECLREFGFSPDLVSITRAILACGELGCLEKGLLIHNFVSRNGFGKDIRVVNSLISMYMKVGRSDLARRVFNEMPARDIVSWNSIIMGYARSADWVNAFDVFRSMKVESLVPNCITFLGLIMACRHAGYLDLGTSIHGHLIRVGLLWDVRVGTSIVDMFSKFGRVDYAHAIFEEDLYERNLVSWNSLIVGYSQNGYDCEAVELFRQMLLESNVKPDSITMANVIPAFASLADLQRTQSVHGFIIKKGFELYKDVVLGTAMVDAYGKSLDIKAAFFLFDCMELPNTATWNAMILGYNLNFQARKGMRLFLRLLHSEVLPDSITLVTLLQLCRELGSLEQGMVVHGYCLSSGFDSYITVGNALIDMYMRCGCLRSSEILFNSMTLRNIVTWNTMLCGSVKIGLSIVALKLFCQMLSENEHKPDPVTMIAVIQACAVSSFHAEMVHSFLLKVGLNSDILVANSLVDAYAKSGFIDNALSLFELMGCLRDQSSWNVMIAGCGMNGKGKEACLLLSRMEEEGYKPNSVTFISLLSSCSHSGMVYKGCEYFDLMNEKYGIRPGLEHYTCMIDMFGRAGRLEEAYRLIECIPEESDCVGVWGALLSACRMSMNVELGEVVGQRLLRLAPGNCGYHTLLSNVYASTGRWDEAARVRRVFEDGSLMKKPGLSMVKV